MEKHQLKTQIEKLKNAYATGVLRVRYGDTEITYQTMSEMRKAINSLESELDKGKYSIKLFNKTYEKGL